MGEWKTYRLGDIIEIVSGFAYKGEYLGKGDKYLLGMGCVSFNEQFLEKGLRPYSGNCDKRYYAKDGDIVLATRQQSDNMPILGMPAIIPKKYKGKQMIVGANLYRVINKSKDFSNDFIYWLLKSPDYVNYIKSCQTGTTVRMITKANIENYTFICPSRESRLLISHFLWTLENKIELNRRINANLEAQAQALFRSWFVDIDEKLCQKKKLGDFFNVITGKKDANFSSPHGEYPFFTCSQETLRAPSYSFNGHAILLAGNGDFNIKRYIGKFEAYQRTYVLIPFESKYHTYLYLLIKYYLKEITGGYRGSVIRFITKGNIANFEFSFPKESFDDKLVILDSLYQKFDNNLSESNRLSALRDTLLPKLMAGEINLE